MKRYQFAESIGVSQPTVSDWLNTDNKNPSIDALTKIAKVHNVNITWLLTGKGDMFVIPAQAGIQPVLPGNITVPITIVADIAAGFPSFSYEYDQEDRQVIHIPTALLSRPGPYFGFRVDGHSMEPLIMPGDIAIVSRDWKGIKLNNTIFAFRNSDGITLKKLVLKGRSRQGFLFPLNPAFDPIPYDKDTKDLYIIGVLILSVRQYNI